MHGRTSYEKQVADNTKKLQSLADVDYRPIPVWLRSGVLGHSICITSITSQMLPSTLTSQRDRALMGVPGESRVKTVLIRADPEQTRPLKHSALSLAHCIAQVEHELQCKLSVCVIVEAKCIHGLGIPEANSIEPRWQRHRIRTVLSPPPNPTLQIGELDAVTCPGSTASTNPKPLQSLHNHFIQTEKMKFPALVFHVILCTIGRYPNPWVSSLCSDLELCTV